MSYYIDRQQAFQTDDIVMISAAGTGRRRVRSRIVLRDGSLYETLTRPRTFARKCEESYAKALSQI